MQTTTIEAPAVALNGHRSDSPITATMPTVAAPNNATKKPGWRSKVSRAVSDSRDTVTHLVAVTDSKPATLAIVAGLSVVIVASFTLTFAGLYDSARRVMGYSQWMAPLVPLAVDGLALMAIAAMYRLRHAAKHIRGFIWCVYLVSAALSVAGNMAHAQHRGLSDIAVAASGTWPVLLALAIHLAVTVARYTERTKHRAAKSVTAKQPVSDSGSDTSTVPIKVPAVSLPNGSDNSDSVTRAIEDELSLGSDSPTAIHAVVTAAGHDVSLRTIHRRINAIKKGAA